MQVLSKIMLGDVRRDWISGFCELLWTLPKYFSDEHSNKLMDRIAAWKDNFRNRATHHLMRIRTTTKSLHDYVMEGEALCKELDNLAKCYKSRVKNHAQDNAPETP